MRLFLLSCILIFMQPISAQKKEISQAQTYIKNKTNLDKAESSMRTLLRDSANKHNIKIYETLAEAIHTQYTVTNEKLYLKEKSDTSSFFNITHRMFIAYESLDSIDAVPDKKGRVKIKLRKKNSKTLDAYRQNLYNGGLYFIGKKSYEQAYNMMDCYLGCVKHPLFDDFDYGKDKQNTSLAAFWTLFCGYKLNKPDFALKYSDLALQNEKHRQQTLQFLSEIYLMKKDTTNYIKVLHKGFAENKQSKFFFTRLMDYYNGKNQLDTAINIVSTALESDSTNALFLFAKSNIMLNMGQYAECIALSDTLIARQDTLPDVYFNAGVAYLNMAIAKEKGLSPKKVNSKKIISYYKKALPYMEKYRTMMPDDKDKWATALYNIYLKLNMGQQFEEISKILHDMQEKE